MSPFEQTDNSALTQNDYRAPQVIQTGAGNVDKIRDILFGSQMRDYETRFARLEETLAKEISDMLEKIEVRHWGPSFHAQDTPHFAPLL